MSDSELRKCSNIWCSKFTSVKIKTYGFWWIHITIFWSFRWRSCFLYYFIWYHGPCEAQPPTCGILYENNTELHHQLLGGFVSFVGSGPYRSFQALVRNSYSCGLVNERAAGSVDIHYKTNFVEMNEITIRWLCSQTFSKRHKKCRNRSFNHHH